MGRLFINIFNNNTKLYITMEPQTIINETKWPDSQEFGTAAKGGGLKIYFNSGNPDEAKERIENALKLFAIGKEGFEKVIDGP